MRKGDLFNTALVAGALMAAVHAQAAIHSVAVEGTDAIFLAGRTDIVIPEVSASWTSGAPLVRHGSGTPEALKESAPSAIAVSGGDVIRVLDPAIGGVSFFNGFGGELFGPSGNGAGGSNLAALGGISGYKGPQGPLVGVFLDDTNPDAGIAPEVLDFSPDGLGIDFLGLTPGLNQIFYVGDGMTSSGVFQQFTAPAGATRLFVGIPDGMEFVGLPGAYEDNDGSYVVRIGVNQVPTIPEPSTVALIGLGLAGLMALRRRAGTSARRRRREEEQTTA